MTDNFGTNTNYEYTWKLGRSRWAWEFLRRNPKFIEDVNRYSVDDVSIKKLSDSIRLIRPRIDQAPAKKWGLAFFPLLKHDAARADVFWSGGLYPRTIAVYVGPRRYEEKCDLVERTLKLSRVTHLTDTVGREHLLLRGNGCVVQVRCEGLSMLGHERVKMKIVIDGMSDFEVKMRVLDKVKQLYQGASSVSKAPHRYHRCLPWMPKTWPPNKHHRPLLADHDEAELFLGKMSQEQP